MSTPHGVEVEQLLFMTVPPPRSGNVVDRLRKITAVTAAAAVYSGIDVVAHLEGNQGEIIAARKEIDELGAPIHEIDAFDVDEVRYGRRYRDSSMLLRGACHAYIKCEVNLGENTLSFAAGVLQDLDCTVAVYSSRDSDELVLEVLSPNKQSFDDDIMSKVQGAWAIVKSTRTYVAINNMAWSRWVDKSRPTIFMSLAAADTNFAATLKRQLEADTGLRCWKFDEDSPEGAVEWPVTVLGAMETAPLHLYLLSPQHAASSECQHEFGISQGLVRHERDICTLLVPGCVITDVHIRYQKLNCLVGDRFLSYSRLLDWIYKRLSATGGPTLAEGS